MSLRKRRCGPGDFPLTAEALSTNLTKLPLRQDDPPTTRQSACRRVGISSSARAFVGFKRVAPAMPPSLSPLMMAQEPAYGLNPLSEATLKQCREEIEPIWLGGKHRPAMLSYATQVSSHWRLGLSAAKHGFPLVLAGLGMPQWKWYQGGRKKLPGSRRALQLIHQIWPEQPVLSSDTGDLLIGNRLSRAHKAALDAISAGTRMLIAGECNSWPVCYRDLYAADKEVQQCFNKHDACYPNSGVFVASARTMLRFYDVWAGVIIASSDWRNLGMQKAERWNDQAAVHRIFRNRSQYATPDGFELRVDAENLFSLQLWKCDGRKEKSMKPFQYCHERTYIPAKGLRVSEGGTVVGFKEDFANERHGDQSVRETAWPFLIHSNGHHHVLTDDESGLKELLDLYKSPPPELMNHPVVLVDSAEHGPCNVTTIGWLMNATRWPEGAPPYHQRRSRKSKRAGLKSLF